MYKDDYISAFGKLAPNEEWMADTLAKMRAAEAEASNSMSKFTGGLNLGGLF